jgi:hypothetical protein
MRWGSDTIAVSFIFLADPHTIKNFRKELYQRDRNIVAWETDPSNKMVPEARAIVKRLLNWIDSMMVSESKERLAG